MDRQLQGQAFLEPACHSNPLFHPILCEALGLFQVLLGVGRLCGTMWLAQDAAEFNSEAISNTSVLDRNAWS